MELQALGSLELVTLEACNCVPSESSSPCCLGVATAGPSSNLAYPERLVITYTF